MPSTTAKGYPYPLGTDRVSDGDNAIHDLADAIDTRVGTAAAGQVVVTVTTGGTAASAAVTFPAGRFANSPFVVACTAGSNPALTCSVAGGITTSGCIVWSNRNSAGNVTLYWIALDAA